MFDWPFDFLALLIAVVALFVARKALYRVDELRRRLEAMQSLAAATARSTPPPGPPHFELTAHQAVRAVFPLLDQPLPDLVKLGMVFSI